MRIASGEPDARIDALNKAVTTADDKTAAFIQALNDDAVKFTKDKVFVIKDGKGFDPVTGTEVTVPEDAEDVMSNNRMRGELESALSALKLLSKDDAVRRDAAKSLQTETDDRKLPLIEKAFAAETNAQIKAQLGLVRAALLLGSNDKTKRLDAAQLLAGSNTTNAKTDRKSVV